MKDSGPFGSTTLHNTGFKPGTCIATTTTVDGRQYTGSGKTYPEAIKAAQRAREAANITITSGEAKQ